MGVLGSVPGLGRSSGEGDGNPLQYSWLENPIDRGTWWPTVHGVVKSWTRPSDQHLPLLWSRWSISRRYQVQVLAGSRRRKQSIVRTDQGGQVWGTSGWEAKAQDLEEWGTMASQRAGRLAGRWVLSTAKASAAWTWQGPCGGEADVPTCLLFSLPGGGPLSKFNRNPLVREAGCYGCWLQASYLLGQSRLERSEGHMGTVQTTWDGKEENWLLGAYGLRSRQLAKVEAVETCSCSVAQLCLTLQPQGRQHARLPCPLLSPRACSHSCPLSWWCHPTISSSVAPFLLLPSLFPSIRVFSNFVSGGLCISPSNEYSGLISFRVDWFDMLAVQGTLKSLL